MTATGSLNIALAMATPGTGWGGMEKHTADLASAFAELGHDIHVLAHPAYSERFAGPVVFHPLPFQLGRRNLWLRHRLKVTLRSIQPDVLHAQGNKAASLVSSLRGYASVTVGTLHGTKNSHRAFDRLDGVIGVSREITDSIKHPHTRLIYNGLRMPEKTDRNHGHVPDIAIPEERPLLMAAGRLEPVKQFDRLINAWARANCGGRLVILGDGSQRPRLSALIRELDLVDRVVLPGHEPHILPWLEAATACVISSSREGFPYILVEALMAGCPVLSTPVSGVTDFLPQNCIAASGSIEDIARLIDTNLAQAGTLSEAQNKSFEQARDQLNLETMVSKTEAFYRDLLASVPAKH